MQILHSVIALMLIRQAFGGQRIKAQAGSTNDNGRKGAVASRLQTWVFMRKAN